MVKENIQTHIEICLFYYNKITIGHPNLPLNMKHGIAYLNFNPNYAFFPCKISTCPFILNCRTR